MKKLLLFVAIVLPNILMGQSITIDPSTPKSSCGGQNITINFTPSGGAVGPYTVELIEKDFRMSMWFTSGCNGTNYSTKLSTTNSKTSTTILIPNSLNTSYESNYICGYTQYGSVWANRDLTYFFRVTGSNGVSNDYNINLSSNCSPTLGVALAPTSICAGKTANLGWLSVGANSGNVFTAEMSDQNGNFTSPTLLGTLSNNNADGQKTLTVTIPSNASSGSYKIKVKSSDPVSERTYNFSVNSVSICGAVQAVNVPTPLCSGATSTVSYILDDVFQSGNVFTAELSNQNGSFTNPTIIGSVTSQNATSIPITLPSNLTTGNYYVRIIASLPSSGLPYTSPTSSNITIGISTPSISISSNVCENSSLDISTNTNNYQPEAAYTFTWKKDGNSIDAQNQYTGSPSTDYEYYKRISAQNLDAGLYSLTITRKSDGCSATSSANTLTINTSPPAPTTSPITVISGNATSLSATNCTGTVYWYNSPTSENYSYLSSNNTYQTPELSQQTTYYAACRQNSGTLCWSTKVPLVVSIDATNAPAPPTLAATDNNFCSGSVSSPKLTAIGCSGVVRWYYRNPSDANFYLTETDNAAPYELNISNSTTRIYAADCRVNNILSTTRSQITITVKSVPSSPSLDPSYQTINAGSDVLHNIYNNNCVGGTIKWYDASTAGNLLFTGNTYNKTNVTADYSIYASCTMNGCESSRNGGSVNIQSGSVASPSFYTNSAEICGSGTATITALGCTQGIVNWFTYANSIYSNVGTGQTFTTPTLTNSGSNSSVSFQYYADCTIGATTSSKNYKYITVYKAVTTPSSNQPTIACNATATLTVTNCNSSNNFYPRWYESASATNYLSSNTTFTTPSLNATTIYYLECYNSYSNNCKSARIPITVTVGCTPPDAPVISSSTSTLCAGEGVNLTATGCSNTVNWSDGATGASRNNVIFNNSLTLTATCNNGLASGNSNSIAITINPKPNLVINNPVAVSPPNTVDITLAAVTIGSTFNGATLSYHADVAGSVALTSPPSNAINVSGTYYIKATTTESCIDIKPVIVVISDCGTAVVLQSTVNDFNGGTHLKKTNEMITASNVISGNSNVTYRSNKSILLTPQTNAGFKVENGSVFKAEIGGCN
ncbi:MAG: hypothetical protein CFE22_06820 [Cytophagaceae bacterium BCCC1]|nr:MAG: hypothetical protein CFE22_06820 [Cytophagaceae bacterium BCCC1]